MFARGGGGRNNCTCLELSDDCIWLLIVSGTRISKFHHNRTLGGVLVRIKDHGGAVWRPKGGCRLFLMV
jgi:hypothetical protein